ncbi:uncharacterized protein [Sinocyclocheilus grahami]|uniref:uncharacterized protein n=1 Tax=Sinocyclocheilus grahami TaxID=75366 RepID=UPI0007ACE99E|nr:PREDICTED: uncharacterized protein LOC107571006 [Sinocyclocheilus grahami]
MPWMRLQQVVGLTPDVVGTPQLVGTTPQEVPPEREHPPPPVLAQPPAQMVGPGLLVVRPPPTGVGKAQFIWPVGPRPERVGRRPEEPQGSLVVLAAPVLLVGALALCGPLEGLLRRFIHSHPQQQKVHSVRELHHGVIVGGDMRADSPGHSAKYGSYTMMDLHTNTVVDNKLVQSNKVGGSCHMEKEGLTRSLALLESRGVNLDCIVTDRHPQVQKFLRERNITHYYDVWHMAKGISKKLEAISKQKDCEKLKKWMKSINNHIYWTAAGSTSEPERIAKWTAILNHVRDVHTHEDPLYPKCEHAIRKTTDKSNWLQADTLAFNKLEKLLTNKSTLKDVAKLSPHHQTSSLEAFHAVILRFAPKNVVFPFIGMLCRLYLAAMHYNENADRPKAETEEGVPLFEISFPKARKGECSVKPQKTQPTFDYVADMMDLIFGHN